MNYPEFMPGLQLNELFYRELVQPILAAHFPALAYSAGLVGYGSDVLGFDTAISMDHNWGPRLQLFLSPEAHEKHRAEIHELLRQELPPTFRGFPVNFSEPNLDTGIVRSMEAIAAGPINHMIEIYTIPSFFEHYLGLNPYQELQPLDWLTLSEQALLEVTAGQVYHDGLDQLNSLRAKFAYYPQDVWLYRLAAQWGRISQEEAFMGRCGDVGDELGSRIIAGRLVRDMIRLAFLMERRYAPYSKWLGTAFARLNCGPKLGPILNQVLEKSPWTERQKPLAEAYVILAKMHNELAITLPLETEVTDYYGRPYQVIFAGRFTDAIKAAIADETIKHIPADFGGVDQFADCVDLTDHPQLNQKLKAIYLES
jgi:hypothetical protein